MNNIKKNLRKGAADSVAFLALLPLVMSIIVGSITLVRLTSLKQKMEYTAYAACRAAVVSNTEADAKSNAKKVAGIEIAEYSDLYGIDGYSIKLNPYSSGIKIENVDSRTNKKVTGNWQKGYFVECELTVHLKNDNFLLNGDKKCTIHMAVEKENY